MFNLLNKKKKTREIQDWELFLIYQTIEKLPAEFQSLKDQVEYDLFVRAFVGYNSEDPGYVSFSFSNLIGQFEKKKERDYEITNVKIYDTKQDTFFQYTIYVLAGVIAGYNIKNNSQPNIDLNSIDVSAYAKVFYENPDYDRLKKILSPTEIELINSSEVYEINLDGKVYFHLQDLQDGDFIGIDLDKTIYKITHDPYKKRPLNCSLAEALEIED